MIAILQLRKPELSNWGCLPKTIHSIPGDAKTEHSVICLQNLHRCSPTHYGPFICLLNLMVPCGKWRCDHQRILARDSFFYPEGYSSLIDNLNHLVRLSYFPSGNIFNKIHFLVYGVRQDSNYMCFRCEKSIVQHHWMTSLFIYPLPWTTTSVIYQVSI